jgi:NAD(P)H dehydrogenase (quinone)
MTVGYQKVGTCEWEVNAAGGRSDGETTTVNRKDPSMTILVTGASGPFGQHVLDSLLARGVEPSAIRAGARRTEVLAPYAERGVDVVHLDYGDADSVAAAVAGADQVLLVSGSELGQRVAQHGAVIDAAVRAGVEHLVYTSAPKADDTTLVVAPEHAATEQLLRESGLTTTILRNNWYLENYVPALEQARHTGVVLTSAGRGRVATALRSEYAEAAAVVLTDDAYRGRVLELGGDHAWDFAELAAALGRVLGREVTLQQVTGEEQQAALTGAGVDAGTTGFLVALDANIADGELAGGSTELSTLLGRPVTGLDEALAALA